MVLHLVTLCLITSQKFSVFQLLSLYMNTEISNIPCLKDVRCWPVFPLSQSSSLCKWRYYLSGSLFKKKVSNEKSLVSHNLIPWPDQIQESTILGNLSINLSDTFLLHSFETYMYVIKWRNTYKGFERIVLLIRAKCGISLFLYIKKTLYSQLCLLKPSTARK